MSRMTGIKGPHYPGLINNSVILHKSQKRTILKHIFFPQNLLLICYFVPGEMAQGYNVFALNKSILDLIASTI